MAGKTDAGAPPTADADMGVTTIAGDRVGVLTRGEVRELPVYGQAAMFGCRKMARRCW